MVFRVSWGTYDVTAKQLRRTAFFQKSLRCFVQVGHLKHQWFQSFKYNCESQYRSFESWRDQGLEIIKVMQCLLKYVDKMSFFSQI